MTHHEHSNPQNLNHMSLKSVRTIIIVAVCCFFLCFIQAVTAQEKLLPNQTVAKSIEAAKTQTYSVSLNDGDYVSGSINQHGKINVSILNPDGSLLRRF